jgi:hypothetical protein
MLMQQWLIRSCGFLGGACFTKYAGAATAAMRIAGETGTAIMPRATSRGIHDSLS